MPTVRVDGFDPDATHAVLVQALDRARTGGGPTFVEAVTYRLTGHTGSADYSYMPEDELAAALARDPAPTFRRRLIESGEFTAAEVDAVDAEVAAAVDDAFEFAKASPPPSSEVRYAHVFASDDSLRGTAVPA
jgi:pyruvate dehydrogenase E1 component alpha subunit